MAERSQPRKPTDPTLDDDPLATPHPSRSLPSRARGYGIAAGYERPYQRVKPSGAPGAPDEYGPIPHSGYYGTGDSTRPFKRGQASYSEEMLWYPAQYGEETSGYEPAE